MIIALSAALSCSNEKTSNTSEQNIKDTIYVGIDADFPPFGYLDNGNIAVLIMIL